jgi:hypothetical protein
MSNGNQTIQAPNCQPPSLVTIGKNRRQLTWINPGGTVTLVTINGGPDPGRFFIDGHPVGPNYQLTFTGGADPGSVWPYTIACTGGAPADSGGAAATNKAAANQPELTNGF